MRRGVQNKKHEEQARDDVGDDILSGALILITTNVGKMKEVREKIDNLSEIEQVEMLTGPYDIMAMAEADEMSDITKTLMEKIRNLEGVQETTTNVFIE